MDTGEWTPQRLDALQEAIDQETDNETRQRLQAIMDRVQP